VQDTYLNLYGFTKPTVAAVSGAAPAGGCWLALQCDYRIIVDNPKAIIGLNETQLGIVAPHWFSGPMVAAIGQRKSERLLQLGLLLPPQDALAAGLVDEVKPAEDVLAAAVAEAKKWAAIPAVARCVRGGPACGWRWGGGAGSRGEGAACIVPPPAGGPCSCCC
jgi:3,2-trans-enoyl-CoA isomerase